MTRAIAAGALQHRMSFALVAFRLLRRTSVTFALLLVSAAAAACSAPLDATPETASSLESPLMRDGEIGTGMSCSNCHGIEGTIPKTDAFKAAHVNASNARCGQCHDPSTTHAKTVSPDTL
jgi:cytochrome c553